MEHSYVIPEVLADDASAQELATLLTAAGVDEAVGQGVMDQTASWSSRSIAERDFADRAETDAELRRVWGSAYEANRDRLRAYMRDNLPAEAATRLREGRDKTGRALFNDPSVAMRFLALAERGAAVPKSTGNVEKDIKAIEDLMSTDFDAYRRDFSLSLRLKDLYAQRDGD